MKNRRIVGIMSIVILLAFFVVVYIFVGIPLINQISEPDKFRQWVADHGIAGYLAMIGMMALQVAVVIIPGEPIEVGAGYAFGTWQGLLLCLAGAAIGSVIIFLFTKHMGMKLAELLVGREKIASLSFVKNHKKLDLLVFIIFLIPGTPKDAVTYLIGVTPMKLCRFISLSTLARIPSVLSSTLVGNALGEQRYFLSIIIYSITAVISLIGILVYRRIGKEDK